MIFLEGCQEEVFGSYSLLDQKNGSHGMGNSPVGQQNPSATDPTRMAVLSDNTNKNRTLESVMASRSLELN